MISRKGEVFEINVFLMILGFSRMKYLQLTLDRNQDTLKSALINGFKYYQGIPKEILFDNMKTVVDQSRSNFQEAVINSHFYEFAKDMGFEIIACRPYRLQTKGKVEALAKLMSRLQPYNHEFDTIDQLAEVVQMMNEDLNMDISLATNKVPIQ
jgi:transposase